MAKPKKVPGPNAQVLISIRVPRATLERTKERATQFGLPYQTFMKLLMDQGHAYIDEHGSLSVPIASAGEERALRTAQKRAALATARAEGQTPPSEPKRKRAKKEAPKAAPATPPAPEGTSQAQKVTQEQEQGIAPTCATCGKPQASDFTNWTGYCYCPEHQNAIRVRNGLEPIDYTTLDRPTGTAFAVAGALETTPEEALYSTSSEFSRQSISPEQFTDFEPPSAPNLKALGSLLAKVDASGTIEGEALAEHHVSAIIEQTIVDEPIEPGQDAMREAFLEATAFKDDEEPPFTPYERNAVETITAEDAEHLRGEPVPLTVVVPDTMAEPTTISDEETKAALAEMEALLMGESTMKATVIVEAPKVEAPIMRAPDPDLDEILALI